MKNALVVVLFVSALIDAVLGVGVLLAPAALMQSFQVTQLNSEVLYLAAIIGWLCLFVAAAAALAGFWVKEGRREGRALAMALGIFWMGIGVHLAFAFGRPQHLVLDAAKGLIIFVLALRMTPARATSPRTSRSSR